MRFSVSQWPMRFFFYGTLIDGDLRRALCGPAVDGWTIAGAELADHRRGRSRGRTYPFLLPAPGGRVAGLLADGLDAEAAAVLTLYEGAGYRAARVHAETAAGPVAAWAFLPRRAVAATLPWSLEAWQGRHKASALARVTAWRSGVAPAAIARAAATWRRRLAQAERQASGTGLS